MARPVAVFAVAALAVVVRLAALMVPALFVSLITIETCRADILYLKDGTRVGGEILSQSARLVRVRTSDGKVRTFRVEDVERADKGADLAPEDDRAERDGSFMPGLDLATRKYVRSEARRFGGPMGLSLDAAARPNAWVFGDHSQRELSQVADAVQQTVADFCDVFKCDVADALPSRSSGEPGAFYCFQFAQEPAYLKFMDKVFTRLRDDSVNDERLALMRRQKGFWIMTPRPLMARYRGAGTQQSLTSNASHQASHALLLMYAPAGGWMPWWLLEGFATWQEIRLTGLNLTYCIDVAGAGDYARDGTPKADELKKAKIADRWRRDVKRSVRDHDDKTFGALAKLSLNETLLADVQQSWSVVEWLNSQKLLVRFVLAYKLTGSIDGACRDALGSDPAAAHHRWSAWVRKTY